MMKIRLIVCGLIFNCLIHHIYGSFICNSIDGYDIKTLTSAVQWEIKEGYNCLHNPASDCTFYISFCQPAWMCFNHYSACQNVSGASNMTVIGDISTVVFYENESGPKGFYAKFPAGPLQNVSNTTECKPSLKIHFDCNIDAKWPSSLQANVTAFTPEPTDISLDTNETCLTTMRFEYAGACFHGHDPKKEEEEISPGAIFLLALFSIAIIYFLFGALYNGLIKHHSGLNLLPHAQFWIGFPLHAIEGCRATLTCCSSRTKPSRATYESV